MRRYLILAFLLTVISGSVGATIFGGTNMGFMGYPDARCNKPFKPHKPYDLTNQYAIDAYNRSVDTYNFELKTYQRCIIEYLENGNNDIKRIQEKMEETLEEAKRPTY